MCFSVLVSTIIAGFYLEPTSYFLWFGSILFFSVLSFYWGRSNSEKNVSIEDPDPSFADIHQVIQHMDVLLGVISNFRESSGLQASESFNEIHNYASQLSCSIEKLKNQIMADHKKQIEVDTFSVDLFYEFRNHLTLIELAIEDAMGRYDVQFGGLQSKIRSLSSLIDRLLELTRSEIGVQQLQPVRGELTSFIGTIVEFHLPTSEHKNIELFFSYDESIEMEFDPDKLEKILSNLISNALNFTPEKGKVLVSVKRIEDKVIIQVKDTGIGIEKDKLDRVFERFYRVSETMDDPPIISSLGIGLSLAQNLARLHGGDIQLVSQLHFGTEALVKLPLRSIVKPVGEWDYDRKLEEITHKAIDHPLPNAPTEAPVILVVDDLPEKRVSLHRLIGPYYHVVQAKSGVEAFDLVTECDPDLILCDVELKGMNGLDFCKKLREQERTVNKPIILISVKSTLEDRLQGIQSGADVYLTKPFESKELLAYIDNLLKRRYVIGSSAPVVEENEITSADETFLQSAERVMREHMANSSFGVNEMSSELGISVRQLRRKLNVLAGKGPGDFIRSYRMEHAARLLKGRAGTVSEIAYMVGYNNPRYFSDSFRKFYGLTPSEYISQTKKSSETSSGQ